MLVCLLVYMMKRMFLFSSFFLDIDVFIVMWYLGSVICGLLFGLDIFFLVFLFKD